jgi:hypothetical protein
MLCTGTTPSKVPGFNYKHQCKLEADHASVECICVGCNQPFKPEPPLPKRSAASRAEVRVVPAEEIDPTRSLLAKDYMRWNGWGPKNLKK